MDAKLKHLEFIQSTIARMATNSFLFKGWAITVAAALSAFATTESKVGPIAIALVSTLVFWGLDAYYLWLERRFVALYNQVSAKNEGQIDFCMTPEKPDPTRTWLRTCTRPHLWMFYGTILVIEAIGIAIVGSQ
jgi:hypothetical protein